MQLLSSALPLANIENLGNFNVHARHPEVHSDTKTQVSFLLAELKKCTSSSDLERGRVIHAAAIESGDDANLYVANTLVSMYGKCGSIAEARRIFDSMYSRTRVTWTNMVLAYADNGEGELALEIFQRMRDAGFQPNSRSFVAVLKGCTCYLTGKEALGKQAAAELPRAMMLARGMAIHSMAADVGAAEDVHVASALVDLYAKCSSMVYARMVIQGMRHFDAVSWNALLYGYVENGERRAAFELYGRMCREGVVPTALTCVGLLKACSDMAESDDAGEHVEGKLVKSRSTQMGMAIHGHAAANGWVSDIRVANTLVDMYAKCCHVDGARRVFSTITRPNVISWNALIFGYAENGEGEAGLELYEQMEIQPTAATLVAALKASAAAAAMEAGRRIHERARRLRVDRDALVATTLVEVYAKCGSMAEAQLAFDSLRDKDRDLVAWTALMDGYSLHGETDRVFQLFDKMRASGIRPDGVVLSCVLTACRHAGLVDKGRQIFESMTLRHGVVPRVEHYGCMIDILGRANELDEALALAMRMPFKPDVVVWTTLLDACRKWKNVEIGKIAFDSLIALDAHQGVAYVLMAEIYRSVGMWEEHSRVSAMARMP